jgi:hypothetical protein
VASEAEFQARARETEIFPGDGALRQGGRWMLLAGTWADQKAALAVYDRLRGSGFAARIRPRETRPAGLQYQVVLPGFADEAEALIGAQRIKARLGLEAQPAR